MKRIVILILIAIIQTSIYACDCKEIKRDSAVTVGLRNSDMVFTGELIKSDIENNSFGFAIFDLFKGNYKKDTIWGKAVNNCSEFPIHKGIWIVYADKLNDSTIEINGCLHSMSLQRAKGFLPPAPPEYYDKNEKINLMKQRLDDLENRTEGIAIWFSDYKKLKKITRLNSQKIIKYRTDKITFEAKDILLFFLLFTNIVLLILLLIKSKMLAAKTAKDHPT